MDSTANSPLVSAKDLVAGYLPGINILNGCNLHAGKGELVGIIGPNGAGKSTLLKALFGLVKVREGNVSLSGEEITNLRADQLVARGIGFVPQSNNVFPSLTIEENLQMGAFQSPRQFSDRFDFVAELFPTLGIRRKQRAGSLSGGERQMVAMGRALMMNPSVLLLDEPLAGMGAEETERMLALLQSLKGTHAILLIEHDMDAVFRVADCITVMVNGGVIASGSPDFVRNSAEVRVAYLGEH